MTKRFPNLIARDRVVSCRPCSAVHASGLACIVTRLMKSPPTVCPPRPRGLLHHVQHREPIDDLAKHRVLAVEVRALTYVKKNCDALVFGPLLAMDITPRFVCLRLSRISSGNLPPQMLDRRPVPVGSPPES